MLTTTTESALKNKLTHKTTKQTYFNTMLFPGNPNKKTHNSGLLLQCIIERCITVITL